MDKEVIVYDLIQLTKAEIDNVKGDKKVIEEILNEKSKLAVKSIVYRLTNKGIIK